MLAGRAEQHRGPGTIDLCCDLCWCEAVVEEADHPSRPWDPVVRRDPVRVVLADHGDGPTGRRMAGSEGPDAPSTLSEVVERPGVVTEEDRRRSAAALRSHVVDDAVESRVGGGLLLHRVPSLPEVHRPAW